MTRLHFDFEVKSEIDLLKQGVDLYSAHSSTEILMCSWCIDDDETAIWVPKEGERIPGDLKEALRDPSVYKTAFNAQFERWMAWRVLLRQLGIEIERVSLALLS